MLIELNNDQYSLIKPLLGELKHHPVVNGVIDGNNLGRVFVDNLKKPESALVWAKNEMFFLIGNSKNELFHSSLKETIIKRIKPEALDIGDDHFNLELHNTADWEAAVMEVFDHTLLIGERVPFSFDKVAFSEFMSSRNIDLPEGYTCDEITPSLMEEDPGQFLKTEILKFWDSPKNFFERGIGFYIRKGNQVIGSCISVFVSSNHYEIGINIYNTEHRGKGLATIMAAEFIDKCLERGGIPHWGTEDFRKDSIAIARKIGFTQLPNYKLFHLPFVRMN
ncbi:GNAT family N-acetyltransferase [Peribacillus sp. SCS-155]|uniref:GNAT family N-acetyltransferase n=1 Tax=Peribacillus sedimenti TaxID=3115297 RepID=UPI003906C14A